MEVLTSSGIGKIGIVDFDIVEMHNLHRQFLFDENDIGQPKVLAAERRLEKRNSEVEIETFNQRITTKNSISIMEKYDIIVDCTDNFSTRYLINDTCVFLQKPLVYASVFQHEGQVSVFNVERDGYSTNYQDLFPATPRRDEVLTCNEIGVLPSHSLIIGMMQVNKVS